MRNRLGARRLIFFSALLLIGLLLAPGARAAEVQMQFYGNQHFRFVSTQGKVILINPWIKGNADAPFKVDHYKKGEVDLILGQEGKTSQQRVARPF